MPVRIRRKPADSLSSRMDALVAKVEAMPRDKAISYLTGLSKVDPDSPFSQEIRVLLDRYRSR